MTPDTNKALVRHFMERAFNAADLTIVAAALTQDGIHHQEPLGANVATHPTPLITRLRSAFRDGLLGYLLSGSWRDNQSASGGPRFADNQGGCASRVFQTRRSALLCAVSRGGNGADHLSCV